MKQKLLSRFTILAVAVLLFTLPFACLAASVKAKYVFLFIGDGMGLPQVSATEDYHGANKFDKPGVVSLSFTRFPAQGITTTHDEGSFITDSVSAGTAIATGNKTLTA